MSFVTQFNSCLHYILMNDHSGSGSSNNPNSQTGGNASRSQFEQWRRDTQAHEQVAVGQQASRPSEVEMRAHLAELERRSQGNGCNGKR